MKCGHCEHDDGVVYTSLPAQVKCTITGDFRRVGSDCVLEWEPKKHGRWIERFAVNKNTKEERNARECSLCGAAYFVYKEVDVVPKYCPNCGAKMNEVEE